MNFKKILCTTLVVLFISQNVFSQNLENQNTTKSGPKKQISKIFIAGLGGAVFGLSTLSFYGRPQDHIKNIAGGFALGIIIGTIYVTYHTTQKPKEYLMGASVDPEVINFSSRDYIESQKDLTSNLFSYNFTF